MPIERRIFWIVVGLTGATFWISPYPPMTDLPQHAGQIALWRALLAGTSPWQAVFQINYFTPYLVGSGLALLLSFILPVAAALKLVLTLAYYGFVAACVLLRRRMGADRRVDWLAVTGFFGLAYEYGLFPFLVAAPVVMAFIVVALEHARAPQGRPAWVAGSWLCLVGLVLFFTHGLAFLFANLAGVAFLLRERRPFARLLAGVVPYGLFAVLCLAYVLTQVHGAAWASNAQTGPQWPGLFSGMKHFLSFPIGAPRLDWLLAPLVPLFLFLPLLLGCRFNRQDKSAFVPILVLLLWLAVVPDSFNEDWFVTERFALFLLPFYGLLFAPSKQGARLQTLARFGLPILCCGFLAIHVARLVSFARESQSFDEVLAAVPSGQRAEARVLDIASPAAQNPMAYTSFPLWYQAEKGGLVDFNFAYFPTQVVTYRAGKSPAGSQRYIFVRKDDPLPAGLFADKACKPVLLKSAGPWSVFENVTCP